MSIFWRSASEKNYKCSHFFCWQVRIDFQKIIYLHEDDIAVFRGTLLQTRPPNAPELVTSDKKSIKWFWPTVNWFVCEKAVLEMGALCAHIRPKTNNLMMIRIAHKATKNTHISWQAYGIRILMERTKSCSSTTSKTQCLRSWWTQLLKYTNYMSNYYRSHHIRQTWLPMTFTLSKISKKY